MSDSESEFIHAAAVIEDAEKGHLFGKSCFKVSGKAFVCFFQDEMVFKLTGDDHKAALALADAQLFDPSDKGRPMREWVQVPYVHVDRWVELAHAAHKYVSAG